MNPAAEELGSGRSQECSGTLLSPPSMGGYGKYDEWPAGASVSGMGPVRMPAAPRQAAGTPPAGLKTDPLVNFSP